MSYANLDPAGPFEICPVCSEPMDYTKSYDHRDCVPRIQDIDYGSHACTTCNRYCWDCQCPQWAKCVHCEVSVEDIDGPRCSESPNGDHLWMVQEGDGYRVLSWAVRSRKPEKGSDEWYEMMDNPKSAWRAGE